jgi:hypothetical protein
MKARDREDPLIHDLRDESPTMDTVSPSKNSSNLRLRYHFRENPATTRTRRGISRCR